jgi:hypothetical protein
MSTDDKESQKQKQNQPDHSEETASRREFLRDIREKGSSIERELGIVFYERSTPFLREVVETKDAGSPPEE